MYKLFVDSSEIRYVEMEMSICGLLEQEIVILKCLLWMYSFAQKQKQFDRIFSFRKCFKVQINNELHKQVSDPPASDSEKAESLQSYHQPRFRSEVPPAHQL